jgi:hypothetical protein
MESLALRAQIRRKLEDGELPHDGRVRVWSEPHGPEFCDACDEFIAKNEAVIHCVSLTRRTYWFHVECMYVWYLESTPGIPSARIGAPARREG